MIDADKSKYCSIIAFVVLVALQAISCERSFDPLQENDQYDFSIYGALSLYADTQWVRVMPIGETLIPTDPEPNSVEVTLTNEGTGEVVDLNDSLFVFGNDAHVLNYWTAKPLFPNEIYTIRAEAPDGRFSSVQVTIPSELSKPMAKYSEEEEWGEVKGFSETPLVQMDLKYYIQEYIPELGTYTEEFEVLFSILDEVSRTSDGMYSVEFDARELILERIGFQKEYRVNKAELYVATGSEGWPDLTDLSEDEVVLPDVISNVENGTGHVAGVAQRKILLRSCFDEEENLIFCEESD